MDGNIRKYALIMLSGILWGTIGLFVKVLDAKGSTSEYTTFMRMFFAFLLLFAITLAKEGTASFRIGRNTLISCALLGFVSMSLNNLCYTNAVNRLGMSLAAAILYMAPIFTSIQSKLFFHEKVGRKRRTYSAGLPPTRLRLLLLQHTISSSRLLSRWSSRGRFQLSMIRLNRSC